MISNRLFNISSSIPVKEPSLITAIIFLFYLLRYVHLPPQAKLTEVEVCPIVKFYILCKNIIKNKNVVITKYIYIYWYSYIIKNINHIKCIYKHI